MVVAEAVVVAVEVVVGAAVLDWAKRAAASEVWRLQAWTRLPGKGLQADRSPSGVHFREWTGKEWGEG